ncbi:ATP synthase complex subunit H-domain-containing protein [Kalaharituber pfeilii]|nr:ATP synthase complex subunit H-domain-containing protein [Kalaharituber pfeilii]
MLAQSLRRAHPTLTRCLRQPATLRRTFIVPTAVCQSEMVQEIYLRELRAYKPAPLKASDAEGQVKAWRSPTPPTPPTETLVNDLTAYEAQAVEVEGQAETSSTVAEFESDWFEEDPEEEGGKHH